MLDNRSIQVSIMHILLSIAVIVSCGFFAFTEARADYGTLRTANGHFEQGRFAEAAELYRQVMDSATQKRLRAIAAYNLGNALFRSGRLAEAAEQFRNTSDKTEMSGIFRADARYNRGNAIAGLAKTEDNSKKKIVLLKASLKEYRSALVLNPRDHDSKINYEIILRSLKKHSPPTVGSTRAPTPEMPKARNDVVPNILAKSAKEELNVLRNSYRLASPENRPVLKKDW